MNFLFWLTLWSNIKAFCKAVKDFCVKYWELLVAGALVLVGYVLGRRNDTTKVDRVDAEALSEASKRQKDEALELTKEHLEEREKILEDFEKRIDVIEEKREEIVDDLSNNNEKLDNILKEKYNLKKGS